MVKDAVRRYPGKLKAYHWLLVAQRARRLPALALFERRESALAVRHWGARPVASVAVIIPTHKRPRQVVEAVESVLAQTFEDLVVCVIDDGAGMPKLPDDERVYPYSLSHNCGSAGVVRNIGIRSSASRYLAFLDDDNVWRPNHLEVALAGHDRGAQITYSGLERVHPDGSVKDILSVPFDRERMKEEGFCDSNTLVFQRTPDVLFTRVPYKHGDFPMEDWELVFRLSKSFRVEHLDETTVQYLVHEGSFFTDWERAEQSPGHIGGVTQ